MRATFDLTQDQRMALMNLRKYGSLDEGAGGMRGAGPSLIQLGLVRLNSRALSWFGLYHTHQYSLTTEGAKVACDIENEIVNTREAGTR